jgi:hypothetical protein
MPETKWLRNFESAVSEATAASKPILIDFTAAPM